MRKILLVGAVAVLAIVAPALAGAQSQSKGKHKTHQSTNPTSQTLETLGQQLAGPSQAGSLFQVGQQLPAGFSNFTSLGSLPAPVRALVPSGFDYILQGGSVAVVDPVSRIVRQVIPIPQ